MAERIYRSKQSERFKLTIIGTEYELILQTNRLAMEAKPKGKAVQWHIVEGTAFDKARLENVYRQIERYINDLPSSFQGTLNFIDHF